MDLYNGPKTRILKTIYFVTNYLKTKSKPLPKSSGRAFSMFTDTITMYRSIPRKSICPLFERESGGKFLIQEPEQDPVPLIGMVKITGVWGTRDNCQFCVHDPLLKQIAICKR